MRNSGSVIGGAINFSTNSSRSLGGGVAWATYLIFVGIGTSKAKMQTGCSLIKSRVHRTHLGTSTV